MGRLFEGFEILCTDYDHMLEKSGDIIQGRTLYKGGHYSRKHGIYFFSVTNNFSKLFQLDHLQKSHFLDKRLQQLFTIWQFTVVTTIPLTLLILINCKIIYILRASSQINDGINYSNKNNGLRIHTR